MKDIFIDKELMCSIVLDEVSGEEFFEAMVGGAGLYPVRVLLGADESRALMQSCELRREWIWLINHEPSRFLGRVKAG